MGEVPRQSGTLEALVARLRKIESDIARLATARRLRNAAIDRSDGSKLATFDDTAVRFLRAAGTAVVVIDDTGLTAYRADGSKIATFSDTGVIAFRTDGSVIAKFDDAGLTAYRTGGSVIARFDDSGMTMYRGDGAAIFGAVDSAGQSRVQFQRGDGTTAAALFIPSGQASETFSIFDANGTEIVGVDTQSGQGLARPYVPLPMTPTLDFNQASSTVNTTFTDLLIVTMYKQHPRAFIRVYVGMDAATAGEVRVMDGATVIGAAQAIAAGAVVYADFTVTVPGGHMASKTLTVQGRRTSGTGKIKVIPVCAYGIQS